MRNGGILEELENFILRDRQIDTAIEVHYGAELQFRNRNTECRFPVAI